MPVAAASIGLLENYATRLLEAEVPNNPAFDTTGVLCNSMMQGNIISLAGTFGGSVQRRTDCRPVRTCSWP
jgi:hypothetical protein